VNRRKFLQRTAGSIGALAFNACGGSDEVLVGDTGPGSVSPPPSPGPVGSTPEGAAPPLPAPATPVPLPPTTIPTTPGAFVTWDGGSGPSRSRWLNKLEVPWSNAGTGDWLDANQQSQGSAPIAAATISATGPVAFDVAPLVRRWLAGAHNRGFYLSSRRHGQSRSPVAHTPILRVARS
jgi:hypothetical protein